MSFQDFRLIGFITLSPNDSRNAGWPDGCPACRLPAGPSVLNRALPTTWSCVKAAAAGSWRSGPIEPWRIPKLISAGNHDQTALMAADGTDIYEIYTDARPTR